MVQRGGSIKALEVNLTEEQRKTITDFMNYLNALNKKDNTKKRYHYCIFKFLQIAGDGFDFDKATKENMVRVIGQINSSDLAPETKRKIGISIKFFYKWYKGDGEIYPKMVSWIKTSATTKVKLPEDLLTEEDVLKMINNTSNIRDRAIIATIGETGGRCGEIFNLHIKDVELDGNNTKGHILLNGKTGMRKIPISLCVPYLTSYLDTISHIKDPSKSLWLDTGSWTDKEEPITRAAIAKVLKIAARKAGIKKRVYPHLFRHSRATQLASKLTEQQLKYYFGWTGGSDMPATYVHLSGRDIDDAVFNIYSGNNSESKVEIKLQSNKICPRCRQMNGMALLHCDRCGASLDLQKELIDEDDIKVIREFLKKVAKNPKLFEEVFS